MALPSSTCVFQDHPGRRRKIVGDHAGDWMARPESVPSHSHLHSIAQKEASLTSSAVGKYGLAACPGITLMVGGRILQCGGWWVMRFCIPCRGKGDIIVSFFLSFLASPWRQEMSRRKRQCLLLVVCQVGSMHGPHACSPPPWASQWGFWKYRSPHVGTVNLPST